MWIPRLVLGLLVLYNIGRVGGQDRYLMANPSFSGAVVAFLVGYTTNRILDPRSGGEPVDRCPKGWFKRIDRCYFFSEKATSWYGAEAKCRAMGGYLAIPDTEQENNILKELSQSEQTRISTKFPDTQNFNRWIGIHTVDAATFKKIISNETPTFTNFVGALPDLTVNMCVEMDDDTDFTWAAQRCFLTFFYICERTLNQRFRYNI